MRREPPATSLQPPAGIIPRRSPVTVADSLIATAPMAALASADPVMGDVDR